MKKLLTLAAASILPLALLASLPPFTFDNAQVILQVDGSAPYVATTKDGALKLFDAELLKSLEIGNFEYKVISEAEAYVRFNRPGEEASSRIELVFKDRVSGAYVLVSGDKRLEGKFIVTALEDGGWSYDASTGVWTYIEDGVALS